MGALHCLVGWYCRPYTVDLVDRGVKGVEQDLIPYVGQLVLAKINIEGWIIDPYEHSLLGGPRNSTGESIQFGMMT